MWNRRTWLNASGVAGSLWLASPWTVGGNLAAFQDAEGPRLIDGMLVHSETPRNSETPLDRLIESWITPNERFYVRSHAPVPTVDVAAFRLSVEGLVDKPLELAPRQIAEQFKRQSMVATMTCAGNRRGEHDAVKPVGGVIWRAGAIGNARWGGVRLSDLLRAAGLKSGAKHVWFEGVDRVDHDGGVIPFGGSIPMEKAMADSPAMPGALVADTMNEQPLTPDHGFPFRTVVPGYIGARSVKWLGKIIVSDRPSPNHYLADAYKLVDEGTEADWSAAPPIYNYPINAVTCVPSADAAVRPGRLTVRGYALPPGVPGRTIARVEVSVDGGRRWRPAEFTSRARAFCWRFWKADVPITAETTELVVRATDSAGIMQPKSVAWNLKGYLFNGFHHTPIRVRAS